MRATVLAQCFREPFPFLDAKPELDEEPRLARAVTMRWIEQTIHDLLALDHQLVSVGQIYLSALTFRARILIRRTENLRASQLS